MPLKLTYLAKTSVPLEIEGLTRRKLGSGTTFAQPAYNHGVDNELDQGTGAMAANYRLELHRAFEACDRGKSQRLDSLTRTGFPGDPIEDDWKLLEIMYSFGVNAGYAKGFVHATALVLVAILAAAVWTSL
jgi:hypothetical protein